MPALTVLFVKTSLIYLLVGFTIGMLLLWQKAAYLGAGIWRLLPMHLELLTFGWIIQLVMGVAFWMLPRFSQAPVRGNDTAARTSYLLLNAGILVVSIHPFLPMPELLALCGRLLELSAITLFAINSWQRAKPFGAL